MTTSTQRSTPCASLLAAVPLWSLRGLFLERDIEDHGVARVGGARVVHDDEATRMLRVANPVAHGALDDRQLSFPLTGGIGLQQLRVREVARIAAAQITVRRVALEDVHDLARGVAVPAHGHHLPAREVLVRCDTGLQM